MRKRYPLIIVWLLSLAANAQIESELSCRRFTTQDGLPQIQTERVWQDSRGYIYIGTLSGFVRYDGRSFTPFLKGKRENIVGFAEIDGQVRALNFRRQWIIDDDNVRMISVDPERRWLLNNANSSDLPNGYVLLEDDDELNRRICKVTARGFEPLYHGRVLDEMTPDRRLYIDPSDGKVRVPTGKILTFYRQGKTLYGFACDGVYIVTDYRAKRLVRADWQSAYFGLIVRPNQDGSLIIADEHALYTFDGKTVKKIADGFNLIKDLLVDKWGRLWVATYQGLYCYFGQHFTNHQLTDEADIVRAVAIDGGGHKVMGTLNGKVIVDDKIVLDDPEQYYAASAVSIGGKVYLAAHGCIQSVDSSGISSLPLPQERYQFVAKTTGRRDSGNETDGRLIIGTRSSILGYDLKTGDIDTMATGIPHPWCAAQDCQGRLWTGCSAGLFSGSEKVDNPKTLAVTTMERTPQGDILFASSDSLFLVIDGEVTAQNHKMPALKGHEIRSVHISPRGFLVVAVIDGLFVSRISNDYQISDVHFFDHNNGFTLIEPLMATMAEESDGTVWLAGVEQMASFKPEALLGVNEEDTIIRAPLWWYEHWLTWLVAILLVAGVIWLLALRYEKKRTRQKMLQLQREKKQNELQISAIRLKAIPHFHANVLAAIEYFVMNNSAEEATKYLKIYSDFTNETLQNIDKAARTVNEETEYIRKYLELEKLRYGERLQYRIDIGSGVNRQTLLPTMLLHTYCQNAIKHGISHKAEGGEVRVSISDRNGDTIVSVEDSGIGITAAEELSRDSTKQGLRILDEQIQLYNKTNSRAITEDVTELKDDDGKCIGTRFQLIIPSGFSYR